MVFRTAADAIASSTQEHIWYLVIEKLQLLVTKGLTMLNASNPAQGLRPKLSFCELEVSGIH